MGKVKPRLFKVGHRECWGRQLVNPTTWRFSDPQLEENSLKQAPRNGIKIDLVYPSERRNAKG